MLTRMKLGGFKPFNEAQEIPIAPITLIYGPNSAGKSSIIQSLLLIKQSMLTSQNDTDTPVFRGDYIDLGSFKSAVHAHDLNREIEILIGFKPERSRSRGPFWGPMGPVDQNNSLTADIRFRAAKGLDTKVRAKTSSELHEMICNYSLFPGVLDRPEPYTLRLAFKKTSAKQSRRRSRVRRYSSTQTYICSNQETVKNLLKILIVRQAYTLGARVRHERGIEGRALYRIAAGLRLHAQDQDLKKLFQLILLRLDEIVAKFSDSFFEEFEKGHEIDSRCLIPIFGHIFREQSVQSIHEKIESIMNSLIDQKEGKTQRTFPTISSRYLFEPIDQINYGITSLLDGLSYLGPLRQPPSRHYTVSGGSTVTVGKSGQHTSMLVYHGADTIEREINKWFTEFEIPYSLRRKTHGDEIVGQLLSLNLKEKSSGIEVGPADVGFGIGQLLPIIVEGVASKSRIITVEQPEIHLHPRLQGSLADFFIETSRDEERDEPLPKKQWLIETHSESLMLRMQRRIREGRISKDDVSVLYVAPTEDGVSEVIPLRLNDNGEFIDEWPEGFFEERYHEVFELDL